MTGLYEAEFETCAACGRTTQDCRCGEPLTFRDRMILVVLAVGLVGLFGCFIVGAWTIAESLL